MAYTLKLHRTGAAPTPEELRVSDVVTAYDRCVDLLHADASLRAVELFHHDHLLHTVRRRPADRID